MKKLIIPFIALALIVGFANAKYLYQYEPDWDTKANLAVETGIVSNTDEYVGSYDQNIALLGIYENNLGVAIPTVIAWFEDTLQASITASSTSLTLVSGTDKIGNSLSGTYGFTIDEGGANEEIIIATCAATACTGLVRGVSVVDGETSVYALIHSHRRGASIKITNAPTLIVLQRVANGDEGFPNLLWYSDQPSFSSTTDIVTKKYVDDVGAGGFTASNIATGYGLRVFGTAPETVGIASSTLWGLRFDNDGGLQIATSSGTGIYIDTDGTIKVATTSDFAWTGNHSWSSDLTMSASSTMATTTITDLRLQITDGTYIDGNQLVDGTDITDLHLHSNIVTIGENSDTSKFTYFVAPVNGSFSTKTSCTPVGKGSYIDAGSSAATWTAGFAAIGTGGDSSYQLDSTQDITIEFNLRVTGATSGDRHWGMGIAAAFTGVHDVVQDFVGFSADTTTLYTVTSDGSSTTDTAVGGGITITDWNHYKIVYDAGNSVSFYVNGTLATTSSMTLPDDAAAAIIGTGGQQDETTIMSGFKITQEL